MKNIKSLFFILTLLTLLSVSIVLAIPSLNIPDSSILKNSGVTQFDLYDFSNDPSFNNSLLTYNINSQSNLGVVNCNINVDNHNLDCLPVANQKGSSTIQITAINPNGENNTDNFILNVHPTLEIQTNSIQINIDGTNYGIYDELNVSPGDEVFISFNFINNYDQSLGHVETEVNANTGTFSGLPYSGTCTGVNCDNGDWALAPNSIGSDQFTFRIPENINTANFSLNLKVHYDWLWVFQQFDDEINVNFNIVKKQADIKIINTNLTDDKLTCTRTAKLNLNLINSGQNNLEPEILIYDRAAIENSMNPVTGKFNSFVGGTPLAFAEKTMTNLVAGAQRTETIYVDLINLSKGQHTLYIYLVNPYFSVNNNYIGDKSQVQINIGDCLNVSAIEQAFTIPRNNQVITSEDLINFLIENQLNNYNFQFSNNQSNQALIDCSVTGTNFNCQTPTAGTHGNSLITLNIDETNSLTPLTEQFRVVVSPTLDINNLKVNNVALNSGDKTLPVTPQSTINLDFVVTNNLDRPITGITARLKSPQFSFNEIVTLNLDAFASKSVSLTEIVPLSATTGQYQLELEVEGKDFNNNQLIHSDSFNFMLDVQQNSADVVITNLNLSENSLSCQNSINLGIELTNRGSNTETDLEIKVNGNNLGLLQGPISIVPGTTQHLTFNIPATNLSQGINSLTIESSYRSGFATEIKTINVNKENCLSDVFPSDPNVLLTTFKSAKLSSTNSIMFFANLNKRSNNTIIKWFVDNVEVPANTGRGNNRYFFQTNTAGTYEVKVVINSNQEETFVWTVTVIDSPLDYNGTDPINNVQNFIYENNFGKVYFKQAIDLSNVLRLSDAISIIDGQIAVDTKKFPELNIPAIVTLKKGFNNPVVLKSEEINTGNFSECTNCQIMSNNNNEIVFDVPSFSTYKVLEDIPPKIETNKILINEVSLGENITYPITIMNNGTTQSLSGLKVELVGIDSKYSAQITQPITTLLTAGSSTTLNLSLFVPNNEKSNKHNIGSLKITGTNSNGTITQISPIYLDPKSKLIIEKVEINGKENGDLVLDKTNEIEVEIKNNYSEDMENVLVTITIIGINGEDLQEESQEFDLRNGKNEKVMVEFDLSNENIDKNEYNIEIIVEGNAKDNTDHEETFILTAQVDREKHKVVIEDVSLNPNTLQCLRNSILNVDIKNIGKSDENKVELVISNSELLLNQKYDKIRLDKFSDRNNDDTISFYLDSILENANAGTYNIDVELLLNDRLEDERTIVLDVKNCVTTNSGTLNQKLSTTLSDKMQKKLQQYLGSEEYQNNVNKSEISFRNSNMYLALLGILVMFGLISVILSMTILIRKK